MEYITANAITKKKKIKNWAESYGFLYQRYHDERSFGGPLAQILERVGDGPVAVEAEYEQVQYGGGAGCIIDTDPQLTQTQAEHPVTGEDVDRAHRHHNQADDQVSYCQAHDEHIADLYGHTPQTVITESERVLNETS